MALIYTQSRYAELNSEITFQNFTKLSPLRVDFGDGTIITFENTEFFSHSYTTLGDKTITITVDEEVHQYKDFISVKHTESFDPKIFRIFESAPLKLPYSCPYIPPNEWVVEDTVNIIFEKFYKNLEYLEAASKMYGAAPTEYVGWYGRARMDGDLIWTWKTYGNPLSASFLTITNPIETVYGEMDFCNEISAIASNDEYIFTASLIPSILGQRDDYIPAIAVRKDVFDFAPLIVTASKSKSEFFGHIKTLAFDSQKHLFVLDSKLNEISIFNFTTTAGPSLKYMFKWGGSESYLANTNFVNAIDLHIDNEDNIYVLDGGTSTIKKFTITGLWISSLTYDGMIPKSITTDQYNNLHVLTSDKVYIFSALGEFKSTYDIKNTNNYVPVKITASKPHGFIYVTFEQAVLKFTETGIYAGDLTKNAEYDLKRSKYTFVGCCQANGNVYIPTQQRILKYTDLILIHRTKLNTDTLTWPLSTMRVNKEEFVQDWVYNRCFARLWDNMEIFRKGIFEKFLSYEVYPEVIALKAVGFNTTDNLFFSHQKDDIIIGANELVTPNVLNRVIKMMCENLDVLVKLLTARKDLPTPEPFEFCWSWRETSALGQNGITWEDTYCEPDVSDFGTSWQSATSVCCQPE